MGPDLITTVTVPAASYDLVQLAAVKDELSITDTTADAILRRYITSASMSVVQYCNRVFQVETIEDEFWAKRDRWPRVIPGGFDTLQLSRWPLVSITSVTENAVVLVDATDFRVDYAKGQLVRLDVNGYPRPWPIYPIAVVYAAGFSTIPSDVADAVTRMVVSRYSARGRDPYEKRSEVVGVYISERWIPNTATGNMTPDIQDILDNYRVPVLA